MYPHPRLLSPGQAYLLRSLNSRGRTTKRRFERYIGCARSYTCLHVHSSASPSWSFCADGKTQPYICSCISVGLNKWARYRSFCVIALVAMGWAMQWMCSKTISRNLPPLTSWEIQQAHSTLRWFPNLTCASMLCSWKQLQTFLSRFHLDLSTLLPAPQRCQWRFRYEIAVPG